MTKDKSKWRPATQMVRGGLQRTEFNEASEALFLTSGYVYGSAQEAMEAFDGTCSRHVYSRFSNPTVRMFEERLALVEGAVDCRATATGMAAVFASLACMLQAGDRVVASRALFGSSQWILNEYLPRFGVETLLVDGTDLEAWKDALAEPTNAVLLETPSNPTLDIINLPAVCALAHKAGATVIVDNVFATPITQKPLELGADVVVYSATKHIDGQGRCLGGAALSNDADYMEKFGMFLRQTGPSLSPFNAWTLLKGLETLELRFTQHCANALKIAQALEGNAKVAKVLYPGLESHPQHKLAMSQASLGGNIIAIELTGGQDAAFAFLDGLNIIDISNNLGDTKSLITHPATTTHQRLEEEVRVEQGITAGLVRLSVGLEDVDDLIEDLLGSLS